jgi:hypothetical protein
MCLLNEEVSIILMKETNMDSIADGSMIVQTSCQSVPSTPTWFGEVALIVQHLRKHEILSALGEQVRFARRRFGHYEVIDFVAVLFGYAISGERTLEAFYQRLHPFASAFMALFGRERLPARSTLSRFLAALPPEPVEALRAVFLSDLLARPLVPEDGPAGLWDRAGNQWHVFDIDGTREAARQRALPKTPALPVPQRRLRPLCAPGYTGRKRGEVVRSRTTILQAHTHQWLGSFGGPGNGKAREELRRAVAQIQRYLAVHQVPAEQVLVRLDGQYGTGATLFDLAGLPFVMRGKDYQVLSQTEIQFRLSLPPDQQFHRPESAYERTLYDCPDVAVGPSGQRCRVVVATHPAGPKKPRVGVERDGVVYELFLTMLPQGAFTAADVVALYLHRGAFENALSDEDSEQDPDRWCSHAAWGQECWQIINQWVWNLRLELGHHLLSDAVRTTEFASAHLVGQASVAQEASPIQGYGPTEVATGWKADRFTGHDFAFQPDGTLHCPAGQKLSAHERRREADGSLRVVYAASIRSCRPCPLREQCQWLGKATAKPRQVSVLLHPLQIGSAPLLWRDWSRRRHRRACMHLLRQQQVTIHIEREPAPCSTLVHLSRAQRAHSRLNWSERLARNARILTASRVTIKLFGVPEPFALLLGLALA